MLTYSTHKAVVMPNVAQGFQELVSSLDWELTAMTSSPKQTVEVYLPETQSHDTNSICYIHSLPVLFIASMRYAFFTLPKVVNSHLVHSMALHPPGGRCCF